MGIEVFLGEPPQHIKEWIINHGVKQETHVKFVDGTEGDYLIKGDMNQQALQNAGLIETSISEPSWIKQPIEVNVGSAVTSITGYTFLYCRSLTNVTIPDSVTSIGDSAFSGCGLTSIVIPDSVTSIGDSTFSGCHNITNITISNNVTSIGNYAFNYCTRLTSVTIGGGVTSIGKFAFEECSNLTSVTFSGKNKSTVQGMANYSWNLKSGCIIHCADGDITI